MTCGHVTPCHERIKLSPNSFILSYSVRRLIPSRWAAKERFCVPSSSFAAAGRFSKAAFPLSGRIVVAGVNSAA